MKKYLLGAALIAIPGSGIVYGAVLIYRAAMKKPKTLRDFVTELKAEAKKDVTDETR